MAAGGAAKEPGEPKGIIEPFNCKGVRLGEGRLKKQFEQVRDFYLGLNDNDILKGYRIRADQVAPGEGIGGSYSKSGLCFGQWLSGFARMYSITGEGVLRDKAVYLMEQWAETIGQDGSFYYGDGSRWNYYGGSYNQKPSYYLYDKQVGGLVDIYEYIGDERALGYLERITAWAEKNLARSKPYALPSEWYTLSENLYRAYEVTGDKRYFDFAKVWEYPEYWGFLARGESVFQDILQTNPKHESYHAYSHVNCLSGAAMAYRVTGERHYLDTIINAYDFMQNTQCYATGGFGPEEQFVVPDGLSGTLRAVRRNESGMEVPLEFHFETTCGSWAAFKLSRYLQSFTGQARYGDWAERLIYNGVGALTKINKYGMIMYGSRYDMYGAQKSNFTVWFCCQGSLPMTVADYHNLIYYHDEGNLYVNLFVPSEVQWDGPDGPITVVQETRFPEEETVLLRIEPGKGSRFGLKFRVPLWAKSGVEVKINNKPAQIETTPGRWASIERKWEPNDRVALRFDLSVRLEPVVNDLSPVAVMRGPVVMVACTARESEGSVPTEGSLRFPADWLINFNGLIHSSSFEKPIDRKKVFHSNQVFRPFYDVRAGEYYRMYFDLAGAAAIGLQKIAFGGEWAGDERLRYTAEEGSYFEAKFEGSRLLWEGLRGEDAGIAKVSIDGRDVGEADQYGYTHVHVARLDQRQVPFRWSISGLSGGEHTVRVTALGRKNPVSTGTKINVKRLVSYP